ncbi:nucleotidyltransferase domain-containing protein [Caldivirga sp. UBA161]|uniref:nucleotidyltransferase domain-containing protein n=1 Tax=Caldivirga sp. UBA161 TaxID=1915569 RepID=UPI0025BC4287|nr:nucleotidyltransferase domain-containing protein [Caldivirga sp. UBA161]
MYIEEGKRALEAMNNYMEVAERIKKLISKSVSGARVLVFGSVVRGKYTAASDIDILIIANVSKEAADALKARIYGEIDAPVEIHVVTQEQYERWYRRFIDNAVEV